MDARRRRLPEPADGGTQLAFLATATNVILLGLPEVGKTHLACSLATAALDAGHTALFITLRELGQ